MLVKLIKNILLLVAFGSIAYVAFIYLFRVRQSSSGMIDNPLTLPRKKNNVTVAKKNLYKKKVLENPLSSRLAEVYRYVSSKDGVSTSELLMKFKGVTDRTLRRDMNKLIDMELITKSGSTKSSKYYPK